MVNLSDHSNGEIGYIKENGRFYVFLNGSWQLAHQDCEVRYSDYCRHTLLFSFG